MNNFVKFRLRPFQATPNIATTNLARRAKKWFILFTALPLSFVKTNAAPIPCATLELMTDTKFIFTNGSNQTVNQNSLNFNGWIGTGSGTTGISSSDTYIFDNLNTQTFTHAFTGVNPLGSGATITVGVGVRNGLEGVPTINNYGKASVLSFKYGGITYATVTTDGTIATDGHIATINYLNGATGSVADGYTFDYGSSPQGFGILNLTDWHIYLPTSVPNNSNLVVEFNPGGTTSTDAADDFTLGAVSLTACPITISGHVYDDANGLQGTPGNTIDGTGTNANGLNAILYDLTTGKVVAVVPINADGSYSFKTKAENNYSVYITNNTATIGQTTVPLVALPTGWASTGEQNCFAAAGCTGQDGTPNSVLPLGTVTANISQANFGIEQLPVATAKSFTITPGAFSPLPPTGYPVVTGFVSIATSNTSLIGYNNTGGQLSGSDPEDCLTANSCNAGKTFTIDTINSNTKLYYDFGAGPVLLNSNTTINNYDPAKLVIYGQVGSGSSGSPVGFSYTITDAAGKTSPSAPYTISTTMPLPVALLSFTAIPENCTIVLGWITGNEQNLSHFEVERSTDGILFNKEGAAIVAKHNTENSYHFNCSAHAAPSYYRLKLIDEDGDFSLSNILKVGAPCNDNRPISIYPNPAIDRVYIEHLQKGALIKIFGINGALIIQQEATGSQELFDLSKVAAGNYQIMVEHGKGRVSNIKLVKTGR